MAFDFKNFWHNWFGSNETLSKAQQFKRNTLKSLDKEIKKQEIKSNEITFQIDTLAKDKRKVETVLAELRSEKKSLSK